MCGGVNLGAIGECVTLCITRDFFVIDDTLIPGHSMHNCRDTPFEHKESGYKIKEPSATGVVRRRSQELPHGH